MGKDPNIQAIVNFQLPKHMKKQAEELAKKEGMSLSFLLRKLIKDAIDNG